MHERLRCKGCKMLSTGASGDGDGDGGGDGDGDSYEQHAEGEENEIRKPAAPVFPMKYGDGVAWSKPGWEGCTGQGKDGDRTVLCDGSCCLGRQLKHVR